MLSPSNCKRCWISTQRKNKVIHRDLKLGNLFLNELMEIKIGDFGLAWSLNSDDERKITLWGTPNYIAPEVLLNSKKGYSYEIDVWAIGVIDGGIKLKFYTMVVIYFLNKIYIKFKRYYFNHWRSIYKN